MGKRQSDRVKFKLFLSVRLTGCLVYTEGFKITETNYGICYRLGSSAENRSGSSHLFRKTWLREFQETPCEPFFSLTLHVVPCVTTYVCVSWKRSKKAVTTKRAHLRETSPMSIQLWNRKVKRKTNNDVSTGITQSCRRTPSFIVLQTSKYEEATAILCQ